MRGGSRDKEALGGSWFLSPMGLSQLQWVVRCWVLPRSVWSCQVGAGEAGGECSSLQRAHTCPEPPSCLATKSGCFKKAEALQVQKHAVLLCRKPGVSISPNWIPHCKQASGTVSVPLLCFFVSGWRCGHLLEPQPSSLGVV